jgi:serine/threonine-protein kinase
MGAVYEVVHANTGEHLALKLMLARSRLSAHLIERFKREARIGAALKSDHVVRVIDADVAPELDDAPFLVMELLVGQDLERICSERKPSKEEVVGWLRQVAKALDRAHAKGIVHRDLKPENLFLAQREEGEPIVKLLDFGIAKVIEATAENAGDTQGTLSGQILGTPRYMAPEQASGGGVDITSAVDRYALGLIAFRMLCGRPYFAGDNWAVLLRTVMEGPKSPPSQVGSELGGAFDEWFLKACALEPIARFESCVSEIEGLASSLGLPTLRVATEAPSGQSERGHQSSEGPEHPGREPTIDPMVVSTVSQSEPTRISRWKAAALASVVVGGGLALYFLGAGSMRVPPANGPDRRVVGEPASAASPPTPVAASPAPSPLQAPDAGTAERVELPTKLPASSAEPHRRIRPPAASHRKDGVESGGAGKDRIWDER